MIEIFFLLFPFLFFFSFSSLFFFFSFLFLFHLQFLCYHSCRVFALVFVFFILFCFLFLSILSFVIISHSSLLLRQNNDSRKQFAGFLRRDSHNSRKTPSKHKTQTKQTNQKQNKQKQECKTCSLPRLLVAGCLLSRLLYPLASLSFPLPLPPPRLPLLLLSLPPHSLFPNGFPNGFNPLVVALCLLFPQPLSCLALFLSMRMNHLTPTSKWLFFACFACGVAFCVLRVVLTHSTQSQTITNHHKSMQCLL